MKKTIRLIKCGECEVKMQASWMVGGWILQLDSMTTDEQRENAEPFMASHLLRHPDFNNICTKCKHDFSDDERWSACLVKHGDDTACIRCPKCSIYISKSVLWHKTTWDIDDLELEEIEDEEPTSLDINGMLFEAHEFYTKGKVKELQ